MSCPLLFCILEPTEFVVVPGHLFSRIGACVAGLPCHWALVAAGFVFGLLHRPIGDLITNPVWSNG
jgi:hypothetical protein